MEDAAGAAGPTGRGSACPRDVEAALGGFEQPWRDQVLRLIL